MVKVNVLILRVAGTNCDLETDWAFELAGGAPERIHINRIIENKKLLEKYQILIIPGGFAYGDDISAGKVLANQIKFKLWDEIQKFIDNKKVIIGICNGFQVLVKSGILPWIGKQSVTLTWNNSSKFEDRWIYLKLENSVCHFFKGLPEIIKLPVAHAEGKFIPENDITLKKINEKRLVLFRYCDKNGEYSSYPYNPNGSVENIAGICNQTGLVLGMMPHPERCVLKYHLPDWTNSSKNKYTYGFKFFKNVVEYFS